MNNRQDIFEKIKNCENFLLNKKIKLTNSDSIKNIFGRCKVCDDEATGIHYGIKTCEGCKVYYCKVS